MMDKGYVGIGNTHPGVPVVIPYKAARGRPLTDEQEAHNRVVAGYRIVVEHAIAQMNRFTRVVARLVNRRVRVCPLKAYAKAACPGAKTGADTPHDYSATTLLPS